MTVKEVSGRKKIKASNQEERLQKRNEHFMNLVGNPTEITDHSAEEIISQLDIKLFQSTKEKLDAVWKKIKNKKAASLDEIHPEVWKTKKFNEIFFRLCNAVYKQNTTEKWTKIFILLFLKNCDLGIIKNYGSFTLTAIATKVYNALFLWKNQNSFWRNRSTTSQILTIRRIIGVRAKNLVATQLFVDFSKAFDSIHRRKRANTTSVWFSQRNCYCYNDVL